MERRSVYFSITAFLFFFMTKSMAASFTDLLPYVQAAPDQGKTGTCLFMASTGAMELLANRKHGISDPVPGGPYDLSEPYLIHAPKLTPNESFYEEPVHRFNSGHGILHHDWPFNAWLGAEIDMSAWNENRDITPMQKVDLPLVKTWRLFNMQNRYATNVLTQDHVERIKSALVKWNAPVLINYNDNRYWHVVLIVGFDDDLQGECYQITEEECKATTGSFYVRDSFGKRYEARDYDWFRIKGNAAFVIYSPDEPN